jgi:nitroimidazol reductase NimA-like FMN-containing flavoprotein (pyridoxamine 5'-phosphate oxidase superfamily)
MAPAALIPDPATPEPVAVDLVNDTGVLDRATCVELIESTPIGRIGFQVDGAPMVLPVNFAWADDTIVFRTLEGMKLAAAAAEQTVCFEVDRWDETARSGWSVVVTGVAREVTEWAERELLEQIGLVPWVREAWRTMWVRIEPSDISGRILR